MYPYIGSRPIAKLSAADVLKVLKRIEGRGIHETGDSPRDERVEAVPDVVFPARHGRDVGLHGCVAVALRDLRVAEVAELDMQLNDGKVEAYRAKVKVSFKYENE